MWKAINTGDRPDRRPVMMVRLLAASAFAAVLGAAPALAQDSAWSPGSYWEVASIDVLDGQNEAYADHLAGRWRASQEFAKSRGWIRDYYVLSNVNARDEEPDLYLVTIFDEFPTRRQETEREAAFMAWAESNRRQMDTESGARVSMRRLAGSLLLRQLDLKAAD
jgi:hypothetical protein